MVVSVLLACNTPTTVPGQGGVAKLEIYEDYLTVTLNPQVPPGQVVALQCFQGLTPFDKPDQPPDHQESKSEKWADFTKSEWAIRGGVLTVNEGHQLDGEGGTRDDYQISWQPTPRPTVAELLPQWIISYLKPTHTSVYIEAHRPGGREFVHLYLASGRVTKILWAITV
jgi:hypothetical protein